MILIKNESEIEKIRKACRIAGWTLKEIGKAVRPGITTSELDEIGEALILKQGALPAFKGYRGYRHTTCISVNDQVVHGIPLSYKLMEGDVVSVDVGAIFEGYYGDTAQTFAAGEVSSQARKLMKCGSECLDLAIKEARPGKHIGDISSVIEKRAARDGFSVVKDLYGHGVGKDLHEDPLIPNFGKAGEGPELKPGMVLAIEPMVNAGGSQIVTLTDGWTVVTRDRKLSVHYEHSVLITKGEAEILTCQTRM